MITHLINTYRPPSFQSKQKHALNVGYGQQMKHLAGGYNKKSQKNGQLKLNPHIYLISTGIIICAIDFGFLISAIETIFKFQA